jgi:NAD(P)H dehydrogenase (quinone)
LAGEIAAGLSLADPENSFEIADLSAQAFDPTFTKADFDTYQMKESPPADVVAEQARISRADALVLVYPVYWWSMPALLKGWIDRVFSKGWAYEYGSEGKLVKKLDGLHVHLVGIGGADEGTYQRHGYAEAMKVQIDHGIFDYCGAHVVTSKLFFESETQDLRHAKEAVRTLGSELFTTSNQRSI